MVLIIDLDLKRDMLFLCMCSKKRQLNEKFLGKTFSLYLFDTLMCGGSDVQMHSAEPINQIHLRCLFHLRDELTFNVIVMNWPKSFFLFALAQTRAHMQTSNLLANVESFIIFALNTNAKSICVSKSPPHRSMTTKDEMKLQPFVFLWLMCVYVLEHTIWFLHNAYIGQTFLYDSALHIHRTLYIYYVEVTQFVH